LNLCGGLIVLSQMNVPSLIATFMILPVSALYPLAKRYVKHPQTILASAFNSGNKIYKII
jgi:4-hydroxybenzoate polyprenyltransferase